MTKGNRFDGLSILPVEVQREVIREGEARLLAQLEIATAADQRALTFGGFLIASATAALGGGVALMASSPTDVPLAVVALCFAVAILWAAWLAVSTVTPALFSLPGNRPGNWLPEEWMGHGRHKPSGERARVEQAYCLDKAILENATVAATTARKMHQSMKLASFAVLAAGCGLLVIIVLRNVGVLLSFLAWAALLS